MKLELGSGERPTDGYIHQDIFDGGVDLDFICKAWEVPLEPESLEEVIAIAVMEHLRIGEFRDTLKHIYKLLKPGGIFLFDVPDIKTWNTYLFMVLSDKKWENSHLVPYSKVDIYKTMWGWQRWEGDEHKTAWVEDDVFYELDRVGFTVFTGLNDIKERVKRDRFDRPENAHIYIKAVK